MMLHIRRSVFGLWMIVFLFPVAVSAGDVLERFEKKVTKFTLNNGMTFLVAERHRAPVVSFVVFVDVGGVNEPKGQTGIAHFLEHMAFKGTMEIGTRDWKKEKQVLEKADRAYMEWLKAEYGPDTDSGQDVRELRRTFEHLRDQANAYVVPNAYAKILERNGGTAINAATSEDFTIYFCSLPANRMELWFSLESDRLRNPVFRQFYTEKEVVLEERRTRIDSDPTGRMFEALLTMAYVAHPYGTPAIGWTTDVVTTTRSEMYAFYDMHYIPSNITVAVAGDVKPDQVRKLAETYFGAMEKKAPEFEVVTREPEQRGERYFTQTGPSQPLYMEAYHSVDKLSQDAKPMEILADILARGRVSRLYQSLVVKEGLAQSTHVFDGVPGDKFPGLFMIYVIPQTDISLDDLVKALHEELDRISEEGVAEEELQRAKTRIRADLIRSLKSNLGLARRLAEAEAQMGGWRQVFTSLEEYEQVTASDIRSVAETYLVPENRTSGRLLFEEP